MPPCLAAILGLAAASADESPPCRPSAVVAGDPAVARDVSAALAARGVGASAQGGCTPVRARVSESAGGIWVEVVDAAGRRAERQTQTAASAATVIESWARTELTDSLLLRREETVPPAADVAVAAVAAPGPTPYVALAAESSLGFDGSLWTGGRLSGCFFVGPICAGATLRFAVDPGWTGDAETLNGRRLAVDGLVGIELPVGGPRFVVAPGVGVGVGWLRATGHELGDVENETRSFDREGFRAEAHLRVATPITHGLWLTVTGSLSLSPSAETSSLQLDDAEVPGEPAGFVRLALGLSTRQWP